MCFISCKLIDPEAEDHNVSVSVTNCVMFQCLCKKSQATRLYWVLLFWGGYQTGLVYTRKILLNYYYRCMGLELSAHTQLPHNLCATYRGTPRPLDWQLRNPESLNSLFLDPNGPPIDKCVPMAFMHIGTLSLIFMDTRTDTFGWGAP